MTTTIPTRLAISATGLRKSFGDTVVLDGIDLTVAEGTIFSLLGPNGAGKTTMVQILSTLIAADGGEMHVAGHDLAADPDAVRAAIGVTGQFSAVDNLLTGEENLILMADLHHLGHGDGRRRAAALLDRFDLVDAAKKTAATYSGGMRRRLDLAMTLVGSPRLIFLDEPTAGLDPRSRAEIWSAVRSLAVEGTTVLLTTQYLEEADRLAGQIVIVDAGRVTAQGTPDDLKNSLGSRVDVVLSDSDASGGALPTAEAVLRGITGGQPHVDPEERRLTVSISTGAVTLPELVRRLDAAGVEAQDVSIRRPTLDEVFLAETRTGTEAAA